MSFLSRETSRDDGKPIELYHVQAGLTHWYFTGSRKPITYLTRTYEALALRRSAIENVREYNKSQVTVTIPGSYKMALAFLSDPPEGVVTMEIFRYHEGDSEYAIYWTGRVVTVQHQGATAAIRAEPVYTALKSQGRRKTYSTMCNWTLFKIGCNLNDQSYKTEGTIASAVGVTVTAAAFGSQPDNYFTGGKLVVWVDGEPYNRRIESHTGVTITVNQPFSVDVGSAALEVYPGCDHSYNTCQSKFNNYLNYGGFPWKPRKDPFSGSAAF